MTEIEKDDRVFAPFPIEMDEHPKIIGLSDAAFRALVEATFYSRRLMTDGFIDERVVRRRWGLEAAEELSSNDPERPSWIRVESPRPGWQIHDFEKHHPLRAEIEASRAKLSEKRAEAGRAGAAKRWQKDSNPIANAWQPDSKSMTNDGSESKSETETRLNYSPISVSQVSNAREKLTDDDEEAVEAVKRLAAGAQIDLDAVITHADRIDRQIGYRMAYRLAMHLVSKATRQVRNPTAYIVTAFKNEPFVIQQWIDEEVIV